MAAAIASSQAAAAEAAAAVAAEAAKAVAEALPGADLPPVIAPSRYLNPPSTEGTQSTMFRAFMAVHDLEMNCICSQILHRCFQLRWQVGKGLGKISSEA